MSVKPLDIMMTITQSQHVKSPDADHNIKHAVQEEQLALQNLKNKESVAKIPDEENNTEIMDTIKQGMGNNDSHSHNAFNKENELEIIEKALLDDDNGHNLDIIG